MHISGVHLDGRVSTSDSVLTTSPTGDVTTTFTTCMAGTVATIHHRIVLLCAVVVVEVCIVVTGESLTLLVVEVVIEAPDDTSGRGDNISGTSD